MSLSLLLALSTACLLRTAEDWDRDQDGIERYRDCDDDDPQVGEISWYLDSDGDGFGSGGATRECSAPGDNYVLVDGDCDEGDAQIHPDSVEVCDGVDNDCDGLIDDADDSLDLDSLIAWYPDSDADGFGDPAGIPVEQCGSLDGYAANASDCDDLDSDVNPDGTEVCDENDRDEDCDGGADDLDPDEAGALAEASILGWLDADGDGFGVSNSFQTFCDEVPKGWSAVATDCDDGDKAVNPDAVEVCFDEVDQDCDGSLACVLDAASEEVGLISAAPAETGASNFGRALVVAGKGTEARVVVADNRYESTSGEDAGAVFFFDPLAGADQHLVDATRVVLGQDRNDEFGYYLAIQEGYFAASAWQGGALASGAVYLYTASGTTVIVGEKLNDEFGASMSFSAGASPWLAVGAREGGLSRAGTVYLFENSTIAGGGSLPVSVSAVSGAELTIEGDSNADQIGMQTLLLDGNGDGDPELFAGSFAPDLDGIASNTGAVYVFTNALRLSGSLSASDADLQWSGKSGEKLGGYVGRAGDIDGDGLQDVLVCALEATDGVYTEAGFCGVGFGSSKADPFLEPSLIVWGTQNSLKLGTGRNWTPGADVDGDGQDDLVLGAPEMDPGGAVFVFAGPLPTSGTLSLNDAQVRVDSDESSEGFGFTYAVGEINGDASPELVVGSSGSTQSVYVFSPNMWF
ncbi:MAG: putative metal-binding motif-containing protein [Myxococcota bacterium]|nr:putative metal-binding motif-containing protein [Myxococcota bacterium]